MEFLPPSRAIGLITTKFYTPKDVSRGLQSLGLSSEQINNEPINWSPVKLKLGIESSCEISPVYNQANCGCCWMMSSLSALTDRFMVQKNIKNLRLDVISGIQCTPEEFNLGCSGGLPVNAGRFFEHYGVYAESPECSWSNFCTPKNNCHKDIKSDPIFPKCQTLIQNNCSPKEKVISEGYSAGPTGPSKVLYKAKKDSTRTIAVINQDYTINTQQTIQHMKQALVDGPFVAIMFVPNDFMASMDGIHVWDNTNGIFINGAYNDVLDSLISVKLKTKLKNPYGKQWSDIIMENNSPAGHAVEIVGWDIGDAGEEYGKVPYWIIKNSWGTEWANSGYCKYAMNLGATGKKQFLNSYLALDIPINFVYQKSTGDMTPLKGFYGGGTIFQPDLTTGEEFGYVYGPNTSGNSGPTGYTVSGSTGFSGFSGPLIVGDERLRKNSEKRIKKYFVILFFLFFGIVIIFFLISTKFRKSWKRSRRHL